jgi:D-glutamate N-acetyltransferase
MPALPATSADQRTARPPRRIVILAEGHLNHNDAKTTVGILRYSDDIVVAVIDRTNTGRDVATVLGEQVGVGVPIVADVREALAYSPNTLLIGIAPVGGRLPEEWRAQLVAGIWAGMDVVSGLHMLLEDDAKLVAAAHEHGVRLWDVRKPPPQLAQRIREDLPHRPGSHVLYFAGTDCNVGKMTASVELDRAARRRGLSSTFVATGQTGILIAGDGVPADRVISDFLPGAVEGVVVPAADAADWVWVEGQGSLLHPAYSAVTLGLLHGAAPDAQILCHEAGRATIRHYERQPIPPLGEVRAIYEQAAAWLKPAPVVAVVLNTRLLSVAEAHAAIAAAESETGLPTDDPVRFGADHLVEAVTAAVERHS